MQVAHRTDSRKKLYFGVSVLNWLCIFLLVTGILFLIFNFWLVPVRISGDSMNPNLQEGQIVLVSRLSKLLTDPDRGQIVAFKNPATDNLMLKRVIAFSGETVDISDGGVFIDGYPLEESYTSDTENCENMSSRLVPSSKVFVLSDKRSDNYDSRKDSIGCVSYDDIYGVLRFRIYPLDKLAFFTY